MCSGEVCAAPKVLGILASLIDKSLLRQEEGTDGEPRFTMLETIREYALARLRTGGEEAAARRVHLDFFLRLAEEAAPELTGPDQVAWFDRLEREHNNLRAALSFALSGQSDAAARLATALCRFWLARGFDDEGYERATATLAALARTLSPDRRVPLLLGTAMLAANVRRFSNALEMLEEALARLREQERPALTGEALNHLSWNLLCMGEHARARTHAEEAMALYRSLDHDRGIGVALNNLGFNAFLQGDYGASGAHFEESVACCRRTGEVRQQRGDPESALCRFRESLRLRREMEEKAGTAECLEGLARVALDQHQGHRAAVLLGAAGVIREAAQAAVLPRRAPGRLAFIQRLRTTVGEEAFSSALQEGRQMNFRSAVEYGLQESRQTEESDARCRDEPRMSGAAH